MPPSKRAKVISLAKERRKRADKFSAFQPDGLVDLVGTIGQEGERDTHVSLKAPPAGVSMTAFTPDQAREVARLLVAHADWVEGEQSA